jgi:aminoglycoside phosphotransferase family enzyme
MYLEDCVLQVSWEPLGFDSEGSDEVSVRLMPGLVEGEPVVAMRRLPDACRADVRLFEGTLTAEALAPFVELIATYQANAVCHREAPFGTGSRPEERWRSFFGALDERVFPSLAVRDRLADETEGWLEMLAPTFVHRVMEGRVRECHGGVSLDHLFVGTEHGVALLDPEDGPDSERTIDVGEEVMRLAVDLELGGDRSLGEEVLEHWAGLTRDITLRKVGRFFRRLALIRQAVLEVRAHDDEEPDLDGLERARVCVSTALED